jgi:hypothetical protein
VSITLTLIPIIALPVLALVGWWRVTRDTITGSIERALVAGIWTVLQFSGGLAVLGWVGVLSAPAALVSQSIITAAVWAISISTRPSIDHALGSSELAADTDVAPVSNTRRRILAGITALGTVTVLLLVARTVWYATLLPVDDSDGATYHLPILIEAIRTGQFGRPSSVWTFGWTSPKSADMAFLWLMLVRKIDLVLFGQVLFLPLAVVSTSALSVWAGVRRHVAGAFGATIIFIPIVVVQATTAYVDVASGAIFLAAVAATMLYRSRVLSGTFGTLTVFAAVGLAAGSKYSFLLPATFLLVVAFWPDIRDRRLSRAHAYGALILLVGAHWYIAPIIWYGNPMWPYAMPFLTDMFPNYLTTVDTVIRAELAAAPALASTPSVARPIIVWLETGPQYQMYTFDSRQSGLGPLWFVLWIPAIFGWMLIWIGEKRYRDLLLLGGVIALSFLVQTYTWWTRFTWWIAALGIVALGVVYERSPSWARIAIATLTVVGGIYVLSFTNVQGVWTAPTMERLMGDERPVLVSAGEAVAYAYSQEGEVIAIPGLAWASWNTYLRGHDFGNAIVVVPPGEGLRERLTASGATMIFNPNSPPTWADDSFAGLSSCLEEVTNDAAGPSIYRIDCP